MNLDNAAKQGKQLTWRDGRIRILKGDDDALWVVITDVCARLMLDEYAQQRRLARHPRFKELVRQMAVQVRHGDGQRMETMWCIERRVARPWLYTINAKSVRPDAMDELIALQDGIDKLIDSFEWAGEALGDTWAQLAPPPVATQQLAISPELAVEVRRIHDVQEQKNQELLHQVTVLQGQLQAAKYEMLDAQENGVGYLQRDLQAVQDVIVNLISDLADETRIGFRASLRRAAEMIERLGGRESAPPPIRKMLGLFLRDVYEGLCPGCDSLIVTVSGQLEANFTVDHIMGPSNLSENLWALCSGCNQRKYFHLDAFTALQPHVSEWRSRFKEWQRHRVQANQTIAAHDQRCRAQRAGRDRWELAAIEAHRARPRRPKIEPHPEQMPLWQEPKHCA